MKLLQGKPDSCFYRCFQFSDYPLDTTSALLAFYFMLLNATWTISPAWGTLPQYLVTTH